MATDAFDTGGQWRVVSSDEAVLEYLRRVSRKRDTGAQWCSSIDGDKATVFGCDRETAQQALALAES